MGITTDLSIELYCIDHLTDRDISQLHSLIIDFFAAAFAGYRQNRLFNQIIENAVLDLNGAEESSVFFQKRKYPARFAAFINSAYGHGAELDDGNKKAAGHAGVHLIPAVFALAEKLGSSCDDVLISLAVGYEAYIRISSAAQPGLVKRGFHSTGIAGTLACAAACMKLYHSDAKGIEDAIALATTMSGGLLSYGDSRPAIKPLNPGKAAENGVFAAMLSHLGMQGPENALEGPNGWFHAVTNEYDISYLKAGNHLLMHDCYFKLYPSCRHTHCGIDAAIKLHHRVDPDKIKAIRIYIYPNAIKLAGIRFPKDQDETKFSIYYTFSCALINGSYGITDMDTSSVSSKIRLLIEKIELIPDESMENRKKGIRGTKVEVIMLNGDINSETVLVPKGDPENPLSRSDLINKLVTCAKGQVDISALNALVKKIENISGNSPFISPMESIVCTTKIES